MASDLYCLFLKPSQSTELDADDNPAPGPTSVWTLGIETGEMHFNCMDLTTYILFPKHFEVAYNNKIIIK